MYRNIPRWPHAGVSGNEVDMDSASGEMNGRSMKRNGSLTTYGSLAGHWEAESKHSSSLLLSPTDFSDTSKICVEIATTSTNDSDELELATSESSESDMTWLSHVRVPKATAISNGIVSRSPKKSSHLRQGKNLETRYSYHRCLCSSQGHIILLSN